MGWEAALWLAASAARRLGHHHGEKPYPGREENSIPAVLVPGEKGSFRGGCLTYF